MYTFSLDSDAGKVIHVNFVPKQYISKAFDARIWAATVSAILGGKVGSAASDNQKILIICMYRRRVGKKTRRKVLVSTLTRLMRHCERQNHLSCNRSSPDV